MIRYHKTAAFAALVAATVLVAGGALAATKGRDWPQFRGENRDGASSETGLLDRWSEAGPKELWRVPVGEGYSAVTIVGDRLYTMYAGDHDGEPTEFAVALDSTSGKELWKTPVGAKFDNEFGNGPRSTPTVDGKTVFVLGSVGDLAALSTSDGSIQWTLNLTEKFGTEVPTFGFSTSALVDGNALVLETGGAENQAYTAFNKKNGEVLWSSGEGSAGYNSVLPAAVGGKPRYVYVSGSKLVGLDRDGKQLWSHDWPRGETHAMPLFIPPDRVFASGAEGVGAHLFRVDEGKAETPIEPLWQTRFMRNHFSSSLYHEGHIYGFDNATLKAISIEDASMAWGKRGLGKGSLIQADGNLIVLTDRGLLLLVEASPDGYNEKGRLQALEGKCWTAPTLAHGRLYLRNHQELVAYDLTK